MSQGDIVSFLEANKDHIFTTQELSEKLNITINSIRSALRSLRKTNMVNYVPIHSSGRECYAYYVGDFAMEELESKGLSLSCQVQTQ